MDENKIHIDILYREKYGEFAGPPPDDVWNKLEGKLDHAGQRRRPPRWIWYVIAGMLALLLGLYWMSGEKNKTKQAPVKDSRDINNGKPELQKMDNRPAHSAPNDEQPPHNTIAGNSAAPDNSKQPKNGHPLPANAGHMPPSSASSIRPDSAALAPALSAIKATKRGSQKRMLSASVSSGKAQNDVMSGRVTPGHTNDILLPTSRPTKTTAPSNYKASRSTAVAGVDHANEITTKKEREKNGTDGNTPIEKNRLLPNPATSSADSGRNKITTTGASPNKTTDAVTKKPQPDANDIGPVAGMHPDDPAIRPAKANTAGVEPSSAIRESSYALHPANKKTSRRAKKQAQDKINKPDQPPVTGDKNPVAPVPSLKESSADRKTGNVTAPPDTSQTSTAQNPTQQRKDILRNWEVGVRAGYELGSKNVKVNKLVAGGHIAYRLSPRVSLALQPSIKTGRMKDRVLSAEQAYISNHGTTTDTVLFLQGGFVRQGYVFRQTYDSIILGYKAGGTLLEAELPLIVQYRLSKHFTLTGGVSLSFGKLLQVSEMRNAYQNIQLADTFAGDPNSPVNPPPDTSLVFVHTSPALSSLNSSGYGNAPSSPMRLGFLAGICYDHRRFMLELTLQQNITKLSQVPNKDIRSIYTQPYIRVMAGYRFK